VSAEQSLLLSERYRDRYAARGRGAYILQLGDHRGQPHELRRQASGARLTTGGARQLDSDPQQGLGCRCEARPELALRPASLHMHLALASSLSSKPSPHRVTAGSLSRRETCAVPHGRDLRQALQSVAAPEQAAGRATTGLMTVKAQLMLAEPRLMPHNMTDTNSTSCL